LWELSLKGGDPQEIATDTAFKQPSQLGATFGLDRRRYVAYQLKKNTIRVFYVENGSGTVPPFLSSILTIVLG
jgi:hypothetical protein